MLPFDLPGALNPTVRCQIAASPAAVSLLRALDARHLALQRVLDSRPDERRAALLTLAQTQSDLGEAQAAFLASVREYHRQNWTLIGLLAPQTQLADAIRMLWHLENEWETARRASDAADGLKISFQEFSCAAKTSSERWF